MHTIGHAGRRSRTSIPRGTESHRVDDLPRGGRVTTSHPLQPHPNTCWWVSPSVVREPVGSTISLRDWPTDLLRQPRRLRRPHHRRRPPTCFAATDATGRASSYRNNTHLRTVIRRPGQTRHALPRLGPRKTEHASGQLAVITRGRAGREPTVADALVSPAQVAQALFTS